MFNRNWPRTVQLADWLWPRRFSPKHALRPPHYKVPRRSWRARRPQRSGVEPLEDRHMLSTTPAATFTVSNTNDLGLGSLRQAILSADAATTPSVIDFAIPSSGVPTISPLSPLPTLTNQVFINGLTEASSDGGTGYVEIDGASAGPLSNGLTISAPYCVVQNMIIVGFSNGGGGAGIDLTGTSAHNDGLEFDYLGTDLSGTSGIGNETGVKIENGAYANGIGSGGRNVISGNVADGVLIYGANVAGNLVQDNLIGTDPTGTNALGNGRAGVAVLSTNMGNTIGGTSGYVSGDLVGAGNLISGNGYAGVWLNNANDTLVEGNFIGSDLTGTKPLPNPTGVLVSDSSGANQIGGAGILPGYGNLISGNTKQGVFIGTSANNNLVEGNFIGSDVSGATALPNGADGVMVQGSTGDTIGGTTAALRNVISGNGNNGVLIDNADSNTVEGNFIGTNASGTAALANGADGVAIQTGSYDTIGGTGGTGQLSGAGNLISGNVADGVYLNVADNNLVQGNFIGTDVTGTAAVANRRDGVDIGGSAQSNQVGGSSAGLGNLISGNGVPTTPSGPVFPGGAGVALNDAGPPPLSITGANTVEGNLIGTDVTGNRPLGNVAEGVLLENGSGGNAIGGLAGGQGNTISGNGQFGVLLTGSAPTSPLPTPTSHNLVEGNHIGTNAAGTGPLVSPVAVALTQIDGVMIQDGASSNEIGGPYSAISNVIAFNARTGVVVTDDTSTGNAIQANSIYGNSYLGIDLGDNGVTPNSPGGPHVGPNHYQNYPILNCYTILPIVAAVAIPIPLDRLAGTLNSTPSTQFRIEFYANAKGDPLGNGQGQTLLGSQMVTTDAAGNASFTFTWTPVPGEKLVTATATDPSGNTSEFSPWVDYCLTFPRPKPLPVNDLSTFSGTVGTFTDADPNATASDFTATIDWGDGTTTSATVSNSTISGNVFTITAIHAFPYFNFSKVTINVRDAEGATASASAPAQLTDPNAVVIAAAFLDTFGRPVDAGGLAFWAGLLDKGLPRIDCALGLTHSAEYFADFIKPLYQTYLGRPADAGGLNYWVSQMQGGMTDEHVEAGFIASPEFYSHEGGTDKAWVDAVYEDLLGRPADAGGEAYWLSVLAERIGKEAVASGASANAADVQKVREAVALGFADSREHEGDVIEFDYEHFLGRAADTGGLNYWLAQFAEGVTNENLVAEFLASDEYFQREPTARDA